MKRIAQFFRLDENGTTFKRELVAGATTFFAMVYIIFVNPNILSITGMPKDAVFLATILSTVIGTLVMALFANVPYALAPGMGLNAFFTFTVCGALGFEWQAALALVFLCGLINIVITVTKIRKTIIKAIPRSLQNAIGGGIGLFIAYIGFVDVGAISFGAVPSLAAIATPALILTFIGLILTIVLLVLKVRGAILIGIVVSTLVGIPLGVTNLDLVDFSNIGAPFAAFGTTFGAAFRGFGMLFADPAKLPIALFAIFAFSLTDTFDTIGTFIGTGRTSGIFSDEDLTALENSKGFKSKMDKALFADAIATSVGAVLGTSNTTTYIESAAGIEEGGRTGLTSVFTALLFLACILLAPVFGIVPAAATAPALIVVGVMMAANLKEIEWGDFATALPAFFAAVMMALTYSISIGIAFGFIFYVIVKAVKRQFREIHPILLVSAILFVLYFVFTALTA